MFEHLNRDFSEAQLLDDYCIIMADIDNFKAVNDTHSHSTGDAVIRGVAGILQSWARQDDIVARFGGEEFCIVLRKVSHTQALRIAEMMRKRIEKGRFDDIAITCSFGVTSIDFSATSPKTLYNVVMLIKRGSNRHCLQMRKDKSIFMSKLPIKNLLDTHPSLTHSENMKVVSHVQRQEDDWWVHTLMIHNCDVAFKYKRKKPYQSLQGALVNITYYPKEEKIAGIPFEYMKVVRLKRS